MQRVTIQLSTIVVALAFGMATFAQEPAPSAPPAAPMPSVPSAPAPAATPSTGSEMKGEGEKRMGEDQHQSKTERKAEKQRRKAEKKAEKEKRKGGKKAQARIRS